MLMMADELNNKIEELEKENGVGMVAKKLTSSDGAAPAVYSIQCVKYGVEYFSWSVPSYQEARQDWHVGDEWC